MNEQITTTAELDALPDGTVALGSDGHVWQATTSRLTRWQSLTGGGYSRPFDLIRDAAPLTVLHVPTGVAEPRVSANSRSVANDPVAATPDQLVTTAAERAALPAGTIVLSASGTVACRHVDLDGVCFGIADSFRWDRLSLPLTVLYRPDQPAQPTVKPTVETAMAYDLGVKDGQRVTTKPTVEAVTEALRIADDASTPSGPDWWKVDHPALARAVLALLPGRTEAEVKAEGWDEGVGWKVRHPQITSAEYMRWANPYRADHTEGGHSRLTSTTPTTPPPQEQQ